MLEFFKDLFINIFCTFVLTLNYYFSAVYIKHDRKFYFVGIYLSKFILCWKFEKSSIFSRSTCNVINSKSWSLKCMMLNSLVCCSILSILRLCKKIRVWCYLFVHNNHHDIFQFFSIFELKIMVFYELYGY